MLKKWKFYDPKAPVPDELKKLDGQWVEITGYMHSLDQVDFLEKFIFVDSLFDCCFGRSPDLNQLIDVQLPRNQIALFYGDTVTLTGKLSVGEKKDEQGTLQSLYRIEAHMIKVK